jgi:GH15 family glucan-1,4-alpha-glucosidase
MVATATAISERLDAGGRLLDRYRPDVSPDGLEGHEGAFLLCGLWLIDNLAGQGRLEEAVALYESLCDRATPLGPGPSRSIRPAVRSWGNFPRPSATSG